MIAANSSPKEVIALVAIFLVIVGLVGFVSFANDDEIDIQDGEEVRIVDEEPPSIPQAARDRKEQESREAKGLPTIGKKKISGKSHLHGGYGATFRVVDGETRTGVSNARVYFMAEKSASEVDWKWRREDLIFQRGTKLKADHWGDVRIQNFIGSALVLCEHDGKYGELYIKSFYDVMTNKIELLLEPDQGVKIQVINKNGKGVRGVPVALWRDNKKAHDESNGLAPKRILIWTGTTYGPKGIAFARRSLSAKSSKYAGDDGWNGPLASQLKKGSVFASFYFPPLMPQSLFDELNAARNEDTLNDASGVTRALLEQVVPVNMASDGPYCRPLELPATGSIKLVLRHDDGSLYEDPCVVWIGSYSRQLERDPNKPNDRIDFDPKLKSISAGSVPFMARKGVVILPHVGLFSDFDITVMPMNKSHDPVEMVVYGPTRAKQRLTMNVPLGPERPIITALVRDQDEQPYKNKKIDVEIAVPGVAVGGNASKHERVTTDKDGRFWVRTPVEFSRYQKIEIRLTGLKTNPLQEPPYASKLIPSPEPGLESDVGTFDLSRRGLICRGRILDEKNRPVPGARILVMRNPFPYDAKRQEGDSRVHALTQAGPIQEQVAAFTSNKQGYFTLGGYLHGGIWEMIVSQGEGTETRERRFEFTPGTNNMKIELPSIPNR